MNKSHALVALVMVVAWYFLTTQPAFADTDIVGRIAEEFARQSGMWTTTLQKYAWLLFRWLMIISVAMIGIKAALQMSTLQDAFRDFAFLVFFGGFIAATIQYYPEWSAAIIGSMGKIAAEAGGVALDDSPLQVGFSIVKLILSKVKVLDPAEALGLIISALVVLICFCLITAEVLITQCEAFIASGAGIILLGFGGFSHTRDIAFNAMKYIISVAFKLLVLQLLIGIGINFIGNVQNNTTAELKDIFQVIAMCIILWALVRQVPSICSGLISGSHLGGGGASLGAVARAAGAAAAGAVGGAIGGAMGTANVAGSVSSASKLANLQEKTGLGKAASMAGTLYNAHRDAGKEGSTTGKGNLAIKERYQMAKMEAEDAAKKKQQAAQPQQAKQST